MRVGNEYGKGRFLLVTKGCVFFEGFRLFGCFLDSFCVCSLFTL